MQRTPTPYGWGSDSQGHQLFWGEGGTRDLEDEHDGAEEEPPEPSLGWTTSKAVPAAMRPVRSTDAEEEHDAGSTATTPSQASPALERHPSAFGFGLATGDETRWRRRPRATLRSNARTRGPKAGI